MKKLCILLAALLWMQTVPISAQQNTEDVLFFDDFESEEADNWEVTGGEPVFLCEEDNHIYSVTAQDSFQKETMQGLRNYAYSFRMKMDYRDSDGNFGTTWPTLRFRVGENAYYNLYFYNKVGSEEIGLQKFVNGKEYWLATSSPALTADNEKWVSVKIELVGSKINMYYDDVIRPILSVNDTEGAAPMGGSFCFIANGASAFYLDDLKVEKTYPQAEPAQRIEKADDRELIHFYDYETPGADAAKEENGNHYTDARDGIQSSACRDFLCRFNWRRNYYPYGEENPVFTFGSGYAFELDSTLAESAVILKKDGNELARENICFADFDDTWTAIGFSAAENQIHFYFGDMEIPLLSFETAEPPQNGEISICGGDVDNWYLSSVYRFKPLEIISAEERTENEKLLWEIHAVFHEETDRRAVAVVAGYADGMLCEKSVQAVTLVGNDCNAAEKRQTELAFVLPQIEGIQYVCYVWDKMTPLCDVLVMGEDMQRIPMPAKNGQIPELLVEAESDGEKFRISGEAGDSTQTVTLLLQKLSGFDEVTPVLSEAVYMTQLTPNEEGAFAIEIETNEETAEGDYRIFAASDDSDIVWADTEFLKPQNVSDFLRKINEAQTAEEVRTLLLAQENLRYAARLRLMPQLFAKLAQEQLQIGVAGRMLEEKGDGFTQENVSEKFVPHLAFALLKAAKDAAQMQKLIQENKGLYPMPPLYDGMTDRVQTEALDGICIGLKKDSFHSVEEVLTDIEPNLILASVFLANYKDIPLLLRDYGDKLGVDLEELNALKSSEQAEAYRGMNQKRCYTYSEFQTLYQQSIAAAVAPPEPTRKPGSSGGSGGGGGGSVKFTVEAGPIQPVTPQQKTPLYSDVPAGHWAQEAVEYLSQPQRAVVLGYEDGSFLPDKKITRAEFVKLIVTAFHIEGTGTEDIFSDVSGTEWYAPFVLAAAQNGIVTGSDGVFMPQQEITRQDMAVMLYRVTQKKLIPLEGLYEARFSDENEISLYAQNAVLALAKAGIINGTDTGTFCPIDSATRAQAAKMIYEMIK